MLPQKTKMQTTLTFAGPLGRYEIILTETDNSLEDHSIFVVTETGTSGWIVEVDDTNADGERTLSGMTRDGTGLWFELRLGADAQISYWGERELVRADKAV
jgi:hypothetical protein